MIACLVFLASEAVEAIVTTLAGRVLYPVCGRDDDPRDLPWAY